MVLNYFVAILLWLSIIIYAVFGGADFGAGIWELFTFGPHGQEQRELITSAFSPVWEANNVWLTYLIVGIFTAFPIVAAMLANALFIPITLALIGVVFRGASFAFRSHVRKAIPLRLFWARFFSVASIITPFLLGTTAGAVASSMLHLHHGQPPILVWWPWLNPFSLIIGFLALSICASISATYLTVNAQNQGNTELMEDFRTRAMIAGAVTTVLSIAGLVLLPFFAPVLWHGLFSGIFAIWGTIVTVVIGLLAAFALYHRHYRIARILVAVDVASFLGTWGLAQTPYIVPPDLTIGSAASPPTTMWAFSVSAILGMLLIGPSLWFLFHTFESNNPLPPVHEKEVEV
jgi:cytochrome d ubiquinol oxidase subunit II